MMSCRQDRWALLYLETRATMKVFIATRETFADSPR